MNRGVFHQLTAEYGDKTIFSRLAAELPEGAKIAIVGPNGAGKTTLLELLAGERLPDAGHVKWIGRKPSIAYYRQEQETEQPRGWSNAEQYAQESRWHVPNGTAYSEASGGERVKMRLSAAFAEQADVLLLDEPTNHLDAASTEQLIGTLQAYDGLVLFVSHDRYFIDRTANLVFELDHRTLNVYEGGYTEYRQKKEHERALQQKQYDEQQQLIRETEEKIARLDEWSAKGHASSRSRGGSKEYFRKKVKKRNVQIRSMKKRLAAELEKNGVDAPGQETAVSFDLEGARAKGRRVLELKGAGKYFDGRTIFEHASFTVQAGERLALFGPNGCGKTTLFRMLTGETPYDGSVWLSKGMTVGYLRQTAFDLPDDRTMAEYFHTPSFDEQGFIRIQLTNLGFTADQWHLPLGALSQGERLKVKLLDFIRRKTDVLLLDEPTNHLDLPSREELERTLLDYPGTLLFASHDRYFTERMADGLLLFGEGTVQKVPYGLQEWEGRQAVSVSSKQPVEEDRMRLETELQAVLGELSLATAGSPAYADLDRQFNELTRRLRNLKQ